MALISSTDTRRLVPPHEPESWFDIRVLRAGDMENLTLDGSEVRVGLDALASVIVAWSYEPTPSPETIRQLDIDTFIWLSKETLKMSGVRDEEEKKRLRLALSGAVLGTSPIPSELGYLAEMRQFKEHGLISSYEDFLRLPLGIVEDCRLLLWAEGQAQRRAQHYAGSHIDG